MLLASMPLLVNCQIRVEGEKASNNRYLIVEGLFSSKSVVGSNATCSTTYSDLNSFECIRLDGSADIEFRQSMDEKTEVTVTVAENLTDLVEITSEHGTLRVNYAKKYNNVSVLNSQLRIIITNPYLSHVLINGSGDVQLRNEVYCKELNLTINGSGDINANALSCERLEVTINGSGDVELAGKAEHAILKTNGSGDIDTEDLLCKKVEAVVVGSGEIDCYASETLDAKVTGSGEITYRGDARVTGGNIIKRE